MKTTNFLSIGLAVCVCLSVQSISFAQDQDILTSTVTDISNGSTTPHQQPATSNRNRKPGDTLPTPCDPSTTPGCADNANNTNTGISGLIGRIDGILNSTTFGQLRMVGSTVLNFIMSNKPNAEYKTLKASVIPVDATNWSQLKGWAKPVVKTYHVEFKNRLGKSAGGFDYRIVLISGGNFQGKGKYIGQISFAPTNIKLKTDRQVTINAEILDGLNFGTEEDPIAGVQLLVTWHSPTTTRYTMNSKEYFIYGTGEVQDLSNDSLQ